MLVCLPDPGGSLFRLFTFFTAENFAQLPFSHILQENVKNHFSLNRIQFPEHERRAEVHRRVGVPGKKARLTA